MRSKETSPADAVRGNQKPEVIHFLSSLKFNPVFDDRCLVKFNQYILFYLLLVETIKHTVYRFTYVQHSPS